jgi:hypothetical protein
VLKHVYEEVELRNHRRSSVKACRLGGVKITDEMVLKHIYEEVELKITAELVLKHVYEEVKLKSPRNWC